MPTNADTRVSSNRVRFPAKRNEKQLERMVPAITQERQAQLVIPLAELQVEKLSSKKGTPREDAIPGSELLIKARYQPQRHRKNLERLLAARAVEAALSAKKQAQTPKFVNKAPLRKYSKRNSIPGSRVLPDQTTQWDIDDKRMSSKEDQEARLNIDAIPRSEQPVKGRYQPQDYPKDLDRFLAATATEPTLANEKEERTKSPIHKAFLKTYSKKDLSPISRVFPAQAIEWDLVSEENDSTPRPTVEETETPDVQVFQVVTQSRFQSARLGKDVAGGSRNAAPDVTKRTIRRPPIDELHLVAARLIESDSDSESTHEDDEPPLELPEDQISQELSSEEQPQIRPRRVKRIPKYRAISRSKAIDISEFRMPETPHLPARDRPFSCSDGFEGKEAEPIGRLMRVRMPIQRRDSVRAITKGMGELTLVAVKCHDEILKRAKTVRFDCDPKRRNARPTIDRTIEDNDPMLIDEEESTGIPMLLDVDHGFSPRGQLAESRELSYTQNHLEMDEGIAQYSPDQVQNHTSTEVRGQLPTPLNTQRKRTFLEIGVDITPTRTSTNIVLPLPEEPLEMQKITMVEGQSSNPAHIDVDENRQADDASEGSISIMGSDEGLDGDRSTQFSDEDSSDSGESSSQESDEGKESSDEDEVKFTSNPVQFCDLPLKASHGIHLMVSERPPPALREEAELPVEERERSPSILYVEEFTEDISSETESVNSSTSRQDKELYDLCLISAAVRGSEAICNNPKINSQTSIGPGKDTEMDGQSLIQISQEKYMAIEKTGAVKRLSVTRKLDHSVEYMDNENHNAWEECIQAWDPITSARKYRPAMTLTSQETEVSLSPYRTKKSSRVDECITNILRQSASQALHEIGSVFDDPQGVSHCGQSWRPKLPISSGHFMELDDEITDPPSPSIRRRAAGPQRQLSQRRLARSQSLIMYQSRLSPVFDDDPMDRQDTQGSIDLDDVSATTGFHTRKNSQSGKSMASRFSTLRDEIPETQFEEDVIERHESQLTFVPDTSYFQQASQDLNRSILRSKSSRTKSVPAYIASSLLGNTSTDSYSLGDPYPSQLSLSARRISSRLPTVIEENFNKPKTLRALTRQTSSQLGTLPNCGRKRTMSLLFKPPFKKMRDDR